MASYLPARCHQGALTQALAELRDRFVKISQAVAAQKLSDVQAVAGIPNPAAIKD